MVGTSALRKPTGKSLALEVLLGDSRAFRQGGLERGFRSLETWPLRGLWDTGVFPLFYFLHALR